MSVRTTKRLWRAECGGAEPAAPQRRASAQRMAEPQEVEAGVLTIRAWIGGRQKSYDWPNEQRDAQHAFVRRIDGDGPPFPFKIPLTRHEPRTLAAHARISRSVD